MQCDHVGHVSAEVAFIEYDAELCTDFTHHALRISNLQCGRCGATFAMSGRDVIALPLTAVDPLNVPPADAPAAVDAADFE